MAFSISDFSAQFKKDFARQYQFYLFDAQKMPSIKDISVYVESTSLPSREVDVIEAGYLGQDYKVAGKVKFPDWSCTFRIDSDYLIYEALRKWQEQIDFNSNKIDNVDSYKGIVDFLQLDGNGEMVGELILIGAFPKSLGEIRYDTKSSEIATCEVTFSYDYHKWQSVRNKNTKGE